MSKKVKEQAVIIREGAEHSADFTDLEIVIDEQVIGRVKKASGERFCHVELPSGQTASQRSIDGAVQDILMEYNLHHKKVRR